MTKEEREKAVEAFENGIKCLEQRQKHICDYNCKRCGESKTYSAEELKKAIVTALEVLKQEPREHGEWIRVDDTKVKCSKCEITHFIAQYPHGKIDFCPNCGADMRKRKANGEPNN